MGISVERIDGGYVEIIASSPPCSNGSCCDDCGSSTNYLPRSEAKALAVEILRALNLNGLAIQVEEED